MHRRLVRELGIAILGRLLEHRRLSIMKTIFASAVLFLSLMLSRADTQAPVPLWPDGAPGALGTNADDVPTLTAYLPDATNATGAAMVICPGGGYAHLAPHEGNDYALWLNQHGVTCFVLKYRLGFQRLSSSRHAQRRCSRGALGAGARGRVQGGCASRRHHGFVGGRASGGDVADAFCFRKHKFDRRN